MDGQGVPDGQPGGAQMMTPEQMVQAIRILNARQAAQEAEINRLRADNATLRTTAVDQLPELITALGAMSKKSERQSTLVDARGLGRPIIFSGKASEWIVWARKFENYVGAAHAGVDMILEWASEKSSPITDRELETTYGTSADELDRVDACTIGNVEVYTLLLQLTLGESFDIVMNTTRGHGYEAYRRLARRWDPTTGGRRRNLLRIILQPGRSTLEGLCQAVENGKSRYPDMKNIATMVVLGRG